MITRTEGAQWREVNVGDLIRRVRYWVRRALINVSAVGVLDALYTLHWGPGHPTWC